MGFLDRVFSMQQKEIFDTWKVLEEEEQLNQIVKDSYTKPVVLFKHSIRCGTSAMVKNQLENDWDLEEGTLDFYYLDLINHRNISNLIAQKFNVVHQSPQIIILKEGKAIFDTSHQMISVEGIKNGILSSVK